MNYVSDGRLELKREVVEEDGILKFYGSGVTTEQSMLFKGGYMEMVATVPSDGYSFPAWWLQTTLGHNNNNISNSLYSKIYELNDAYNGALYYTPTDYQTYKYKLPNHTIEIDIFEVIQKPGITGSYLSAKLIQARLIICLWVCTSGIVITIIQLTVLFIILIGILFRFQVTLLVHILMQM